jgi:flavin reductase (DIM6/NTAB) family NADH-FMN oxidoreductase RutF
MKQFLNIAADPTAAPMDFIPPVAEFRDAMRHLASGVSLVTTMGRDGRRQGMLATAVSSVTADPPTILVCVNRTATMHNALIESRNFCVNFLGQRHLELSRRFSSSEARESRFDADHWTTLSTGAPVLDGALSALDCQLESAVEVGSHSVVFGKVVEIRVAPPSVGKPLVYYDRQYGEFVGV